MLDPMVFLALVLASNGTALWGVLRYLDRNVSIWDDRRRMAAASLLIGWCLGLPALVVQAVGVDIPPQAPVRECPAPAHASTGRTGLR